MGIRIWVREVEDRNVWTTLVRLAFGPALDEMPMIDDDDAMTCLCRQTGGYGKQEPVR